MCVCVCMCGWMTQLNGKRDSILSTSTQICSKNTMCCFCLYNAKGRALIRFISGFKLQIKYKKVSECGAYLWVKCNWCHLMLPIQSLALWINEMSKHITSRCIAIGKRQMRYDASGNSFMCVHFAGNWRISSRCKQVSITWWLHTALTIQAKCDSK